MDKLLSYQTKKIHYRVIGNGKPVLLIHGFGEDGTVWETQVGYLKDRFRLIIPDLPGSGKSELIDDMSVEGMAEVMNKILELETALPLSGELRGGGIAASIGHSMGGYILLALVNIYPDLLNAFGLFHSTAYADSEEKKAARRKGIEFIEQHGAFDFLKTTIPNLFSQESKDKMGKNIDEFISHQNNFSVPSLVSYYQAMIARPDRTEMLQKATVPVLFIAGKYDVAVPFEDSLKQCHLPEKSYFHILRKSGHMGMMEEPEKTNRILEKFLMET